MKRIVFIERPKDKPQESHFKLEEVERPALSNGILVRTEYLSVDPYMKGRMDGTSEYISSWKVGQVPVGGGVGRVIDSQVDNFAKGDLVYTMEYPFQEFVAFQGDQLKQLEKLEKDMKNPSHALSILGMPGMTAYFGTVHILNPQKGETLLVTGAGGAVGSMVGQIGKILGAKVVGIAGDDKKLQTIRKWGFDKTINYKTAGDKLKEEIARACPDGINCFFDNVGGNILDAVTANMAIHGRVCICGAISQYSGENQTGPRMNNLILQRSLSVKGFIVFRDFGDKYAEGMKQMKEWMKDGKIKIEETNYDGIEKLPKAFTDMFEGKNTGKVIITMNKAAQST